MKTTHADGPEAAILGACMRDRSVVPDILDQLEPDDYRKPEHKALHMLIADRYRQGLGVDMVSLPTAVAQSGQLDRFGGLQYVLSLEAGVTSTAAVPAYIRDVQEASRRRKLRAIAESMLENLERGHACEGVLAEVTSELSAVASRGAAGPVALGSIVGDVARDAIEPPANVQPISTSILALDGALGGGLRRGETVVIGARPGMGKTALAVGVAADIVIRSAQVGVGALVFSAEMSRKALTQRLLAYESGVPFGLIRDSGRLSDPQRLRLADAALALEARDPSFWIDDRSSPTLEQIEGVVKRHKAGHPELGVVVLDYFQILGMPLSRGGDRLGPMNDMSTGLMRIFRDLDLCGVVLSQLNRDVTKRGDHLPTMADLKGCGKLEEDAHLILMPFRPAEYDDNADPREATIVVAKNRSGPTGQVIVEWDPDFVRFSDRGADPFGIEQ